MKLALTVKGILSSCQRRHQGCAFMWYRLLLSQACCCLLKGGACMGMHVTFADLGRQSAHHGMWRYSSGWSSICPVQIGTCEGWVA